jgi:uncharacterized repeat protein (TIGR01451 family)
VLALTVCLLALVVPGSAVAATPFKDIASAGPLTHVYLGDELSCQVAHTLDSALELFPPATIPGDCGTFVAMGGVLYAPDFVSHGGTATGSLGASTPFTPVSQTNVTGAGTAADPYTVVTVVDVAQTGLRISQTDSYVVGNEAYRTDVAVTNTGGSAASGVLYRAGDCFLGGSDFGYGFTETFGTRKAVGCSVNANNSPAGRIEEWVPLTGGNNYFHQFFATVWSQIGTKNSFPDSCICTTQTDNGAGISWPFALAAGQTLTFSHATTFSPTGKQALETTKTADAGSSSPGAQNGYTITISNPNPDAVTLNSITDTLPAGFSYVAGSTTGATTANPTVSSQLLTWAGPFTVPAEGSVSVHFNVTVSSTPGEYFNDASGEAANGYTVLPSGPTARIEVVASSADLSLTKSDSPDPVTVGQELTYTITVSNAGPDAAQNVSVTDTLPAGVTFGSASASQGTCSGTATVTCSLGTIAASGSATVTIKVTPTAAGTLSNTASVSSTTADPDSVDTSDTEETTVNEAPAGTQGCSHGYWKTHPASWVGYSPSQTIASVFSGAGSLGSRTFAQALAFKGGSSLDGAKQNLLRQAVAALLNAAHPNVDYPKTTSQVVADVNAALASNQRSTILALADALDAMNNIGCPL